MTCPRCDDTGLIEYTGGTHRTYGNTLDPGGRTVEATPENPVFKLCGCKKEKLEVAREARSYQ